MKSSDREALALWHLKNCPLFSALEPRELGDVFHHSRIVGLGPGEIVPHAGSDGDTALWIIKRGHVKLGYVDQEGHSATVLILGPGDLFGTLAGGGADYGEHCATLTSTCLCRIGASRFESLVRRYPEVAYSLTKLSFARIHRLQARLADFMVRPAESRLAMVLLELDRQVGEELPDGGRLLTLPLSHQDLAQLIGSSREMVTHLLGRFRKSGAVEASRERIVLRDHAALEVARDVW